MTLSTLGEAYEWLDGEFSPESKPDDDYPIKQGPFAQLSYVKNGTSRMQQKAETLLETDSADLFWDTRDIDPTTESAGDHEVLLRLALDIRTFRDKMEALGYDVSCMNDAHLFCYSAHKKIRPVNLPGEVENVLAAFKNTVSALDKKESPGS